jgi:hypothetical protein
MSRGALQGVSLARDLGVKISRLEYWCAVPLSASMRMWRCDAFETLQIEKT